MPLIILALIVLLPVVILLLLRINATLVFLSLCLGAVLTQFVAPDVASFLELFHSHGYNTPLTTTNNIKIALLLLPVILTAIFMIKTVRGGHRLVLNVLPAAGVGLLGALLVVPLLPPGTAANITTSAAWQQMTRLQDLVVGVSALMCLLVLWLQRPKAGGSGRSHKHSS